MAFEPLPDSDPKKNYSMYTLADGENFRFAEQPIHRNGANSSEVVLQIQRLGEKEFGLTVPFLGNVYVMDASGKTIASHTTPWIHPGLPKHSSNTMTREDILRPIMVSEGIADGRLHAEELFRQTGRTETMYKQALSAAEKGDVVVVVKDMRAVKHLIENFGQHPHLTVITYDPRRGDVDWSQMKMIGPYSKHIAFFDHDVVYYNNKQMFREYEKYNPPITVSGNTFQLVDTRSEK